MSGGSFYRDRVALAILSLSAACLFASGLLAKDSPLFHAGLKNIADCAPYPAHGSGYVNDLADLLSPAEEQTLNAWLERTERKSGAEIAVVTIDSLQQFPGTDNGTLDNFTRALFSKYHLGNFPQNQGALILVCKQERMARIELSEGYRYTQSGNAFRIEEEVLKPALQKGHFSYGIRTAVYDLTRDYYGLNTWSAKFLGTVPLITGVISIAAIVISLVRNGKQGWGWVIVGSILVLLLLVLRFLMAVLYWIPKEPRHQIPDMRTIGSVSSQFGDGPSSSSSSKHRHGRVSVRTPGSW